MNYSMICDHQTRSAHTLTGDTIASVWECDTCCDQKPFTAKDFAFVNAQPWYAPGSRMFGR